VLNGSLRSARSSRETSAAPDPSQISFVTAAPGRWAFSAVLNVAWSATTKSPSRVGKWRAVATTLAVSSPPGSRSGSNPSSSAAAASPGLARTGTAIPSSGCLGRKRVPMSFVTV
jgi:hypothetical protein